MNTAQLLRQMKRDRQAWLATQGALRQDCNETDYDDGQMQGGILTLRYILDNMGFESHEDMLKLQDFLRDLEMEK